MTSTAIELHEGSLVRPRYSTSPTASPDTNRSGDTESDVDSVSSGVTAMTSPATRTMVSGSTRSRCEGQLHVVEEVVVDASVSLG